MRYTRIVYVGKPEGPKGFGVAGLYGAALRVGQVCDGGPSGHPGEKRGVAGGPHFGALKMQEAAPLKTGGG